MVVSLRLRRTLFPAEAEDAGELQKQKQRQKKKQIPCGNDNKKYNSNDNDNRKNNGNCDSKSCDGFPVVEDRVWSCPDGLWRRLRFCLTALFLWQQVSFSGACAHGFNRARAG